MASGLWGSAPGCPPPLTGPRCPLTAACAPGAPPGPPSAALPSRGPAYAPPGVGSVLCCPDISAGAPLGQEDTKGTPVEYSRAVWGQERPPLFSDCSPEPLLLHLTPPPPYGKKAPGWASGAPIGGGQPRGTACWLTCCRGTGVTPKSPWVTLLLRRRLLVQGPHAV